MSSIVTTTHPDGVSNPWVPDNTHPPPGSVPCCGGAGQQIVTGDFADPNGNVTPADTSAAAQYYQNGVNNVWNWNTETQTWNQVIAAG